MKYFDVYRHSPAPAKMGADVRTRDPRSRKLRAESRRLSHV